MAFDDKFEIGKGPKFKKRATGDGPLARFRLSVSTVVGFVGAVLGLLLLALLLTGRLGFVSVSSEQVGVKVNYLTGNRTPITQPGYQFFIPLVQEVYLLDRRTQNFVMRASEYLEPDIVPLLTVRANDGSNFRFEQIEIQYALIPDQAHAVLDASGPGDLFKREWVKSHARSILRDEFGRYSAEEIADPRQLQLAFAAADLRLDAALQPYGLNVILIPQQRPNFDPDYERAIEERKVTDQNVDRLIAMEDQIKREREQRLAMVERVKSTELKDLEGELDREKFEAERSATEIKKAADAFSIKRISEGEAKLADALAVADGLTQKYTLEAEGVTAKTKALEQQGAIVVREALVRALTGIEFSLVPYNQDSSPERIQYEDRSPSQRPGRHALSTQANTLQ